MSVLAPELLKKEPSEYLPFDMGFGGILETGETIEESAPQPTFVIDPSGELAIDTISVSGGDTVIFWVASGVHGRSYFIHCAITTSDGKKREGTGQLKVLDN